MLFQDKIVNSNNLVSSSLALSAEAMNWWTAWFDFRRSNTKLQLCVWGKESPASHSCFTSLYCLKTQKIYDVFCTFILSNLFCILMTKQTLFWDHPGLVGCLDLGKWFPWETIFSLKIWVYNTTWLFSVSFREKARSLTHSGIWKLTKWLSATLSLVIDLCFSQWKCNPVFYHNVQI